MMARPAGDGLCTRDGSKETVGEIRFELAKASSNPGLQRKQIAYSGIFSESYRGFMDCGRDGSLPLRLGAK